MISQRLAEEERVGDTHTSCGSFHPLMFGGSRIPRPDAPPSLRRLARYGNSIPVRRHHPETPRRQRPWSFQPELR